MGAVLGKHHVKITTERSESLPAEAGQEDEAGSDGLVEKHYPEVLPARYHSAAAGNPEMTVEVVAGENSIDFSLTSE